MYPWIRGTPTITKEFWPTHKLDLPKHIFLIFAENNIGWDWHARDFMSKGTKVWNISKCQSRIAFAFTPGLSVF